MSSMVSIQNVTKTYSGGFKALDQVSFDIKSGEIFALLGSNGAGKTTLIQAICGLLRITEGAIEVGGSDVVLNAKNAREKIGLVPQELCVDTFESVWNTVSFSRGLFGKPKDPGKIEKILKDLSLWDKRKNRVMTLSGGMKRRVMIAKALSHEPEVLFLDEPTAGVDVELRKDMWNLVRKLQESGVTIILTTHYLEEAEEMADRIGVLSKGKLLVVEDKDVLMKKMGKRQLILEVEDPAVNLPLSLDRFHYTQKGSFFTFQFDVVNEELSIGALMSEIHSANVQYLNLQTKESSLEEIFMEMTRI
ncbi:MAG: multidrug ABC transporter ATP-binding protein [Bdellovibrionaceae bacterium]|nr:multidrug ABC transporter ATP-binding protein [Pseudobdellovibrionaceae bacterium]